MKTNAVLIFALAASALVTCAQEPKVTNTRFHSEPVSLGLSATVDRFRHSDRALWLGYAVPALPPAHSSACSPGQGSSSLEDGCCHELRLEDTAVNLNDSDTTDLILLRLEHGEILRVLQVPAGCVLNAGGQEFAWLTGVQPEESVALLGKLAQTATPLTDASLAALSTHATPKATEFLASLATNGNNHRLREKAALWLGAQRGHDGFLALRRILQTEQDTTLREKLPFDVSLSSDPAATDDLIQLAKFDQDTRVRSQAPFWLAQKAGKKAVPALNAALENDPSFEVKKKALFAISQLPKDESVPQLVHIADTNTNFAIRKEAIFWLGQSQDPRALAYIEGVLKR